MTLPPPRPDSAPGTDRSSACGAEPAGSPDLLAALVDVAEACVPRICDECTVVVDLGDEQRHIVRPASLRGSRATPDEDGATVVRVPFAGDGPGDGADVRFAGSATFVWRTRTPTAGDRLAIALLVDRAVDGVGLRRLEQARREAEERVAHLERALESSRRIGAAIGIVMTTHKVPADTAIAALQRASQLTNRKLRSLALEVIDTGWLDPAVVSVDASSTL